MVSGASGCGSQGPSALLLMVRYVGNVGGFV